jgi:hypothetical protein
MVPGTKRALWIESNDDDPEIVRDFALGEFEGVGNSEKSLVGSL